MTKMGTHGFSVLVRKPNETTRIIVTTFVGVVLGFLIGVSFPTVSLTMFKFQTNLFTSIDMEDRDSGQSTETKLHHSHSANDASKTQIWVPTNPRGAESLPPAIVASESDFYLHRLWGKPNEDLITKPKYLVTFTVGLDQKSNIDAAVKKFSDNFTILLFHYDGRTTEWDDLEWSKRAIHISARKQTKWWYAKRFLHPDIVAPYDYIFIWDEDLGVENFDAEEYIKLVRKHKLEISQPGLDPKGGITWNITRKREGTEIHKESEEKPGWCADSLLPPCAAYADYLKFVEIMATVFSRDAWRCVWYMIQNDLVHGWGLDFALRKCVEPAHEKIGVVDSQWILHQSVPSLGRQGERQNGRAPWEGVKERCKNEWTMFHDRMDAAEKTYYKEMEVKGLNNNVSRSNGR